MLPVSSLSSAAYGLRVLFLDNIVELEDINQIRIGHPGGSIEDLDKSNKNSLNLFFYDVNYDGYPADGASENPFYVRLHCLITAVGSKTTGNGTERDVSEGENELRLIGEVMRVLHEQPLLSVSDGVGNEIALLQVIPLAMNMDNLNHIWSTQTDISYRLSVAYEMGLAPVPHALPTESAPRVGDPRMLSWGAMSRPAGSETSGVISLQPQVGYLEVDTAVNDWMPHICFVKTDSVSDQNLHYVAKVIDPTDVLDILVAGKDGGKVTFKWNVWRRNADNSVVAWQEDIADAEPPLVKEINDPPGSTEPFYPNRIDPDHIDERRVFKAKLPTEVMSDDPESWQAMLYALHEWVHEDPTSSGNNKTTLIKSNSILFYGGQP